MKRFYQYINDVNSKKILTNQYVKLAVKRFEKDFKASKDPNYPYYFDEKAAQRFIDFTEILKLYKDKWAGQPLHLEPWQVFILGNIYGWKKKADNLRRFRKAFIFVGRKNGKTVLVSSSLLYDVLTTPGGEAYCAATRREQSKICFDNVKEMVKQNPGLSERLQLYASTTRIVNHHNSSFISALSSQYSTFDGLNPSCVVIDEVSAMKDYNIIKVLQSGQYSRPEPLMLEITSGSDDIYSAGAQEFDRSIKILEGSYEDDTYFCILYCLDKGDDWKDPKKYIKANPNLEVSITLDALIKARDEAIQQPSMEGEFRTKNLGMFVSPINTWIPHNTWLNNISNAKTYKLPEDTTSCAIIGAVDLSQRNDFSTYTLYFYDLNQKKYFARHHFYFPEEMIDTKMKHDSPMIRKWIELGYITPTKGPIIDYTAIFNDIKKDLEKYSVREILFDPWNAATLVSEIGPLVDLVEVAQSMKAISPMAKDFEAAIIDHQIVDDNPVTAWMNSNCEVYRDANGNIKPVKQGGPSSTKRIDGIVTSVMCLGRIKQLLDNGEIDTRTPEEIRADMEARLAELEDY